ncbi:hypothetical protein ACDF64_09450 [Agromyces sp. MMS24-JH15]|uniref:hypothetical protein n=1 Tax=Agromyces sp. MMS24-JH15 TaxID=3243765 RepID=UPI00374A9382
MTGSAPALPRRNSVGAIVAPAVAGILAALLLLAVGQAPTICATSDASACPTPDDRFAVALWWTFAVVVLATIATLLRLRGGERCTTCSHVAFGALLVATVVGFFATLATGGFVIPLFWF